MLISITQIIFNSNNPLKNQARREWILYERNDERYRDSHADLLATLAPNEIDQ